MDSIILQTQDDAIASGDVIGRFGFAASSETGTNARLVVAKIEAVAEETFDSTNNAASMVFYLANDGAAASKMTLSPAGNLTVTGDVNASGTINVTGTASGIGFFGDDGNLTSSTNFFVDSGNGIIHSSGFFDYKDFSNIRSLAIGSGCPLTHRRQLLIGENLTATSPLYNAGEGQISLGFNNTVGKSSVVIGYNSTGGDGVGGCVGIGYNVTGGGRSAVAIGSSASAAGNNGTVAIGASASAEGYGTSIGKGATTDLVNSNSYGVAIGNSATSDGGGVAIGYNTHGARYSVGIMTNGQSARAQTFLCGNSTSLGNGSYSQAMHNVYFGAGYEHTVDMNGYYVNFYGTHGNGTDIGGMAVRMRPGYGTGSARGGNFEIDLALAGSTGSSANSYSNVFKADASDGSVYTLAANATTVPSVVKGATSQSANLQEWQDSSSAVLAKVASDGSITTSGTMTAAGNLDLAGNIELENHQFVVGKQTGGATRNILGLDDANEVQLGNNNVATNLKGSSINIAAATTVNAALKVKNGDTSAGFIEFYEDSDNGTNKVTLIGRTSTGSDLTVSLPAYTGTLICSAGTHTITASAATDTPLINKGAGSQSASLQEWQNNSATKLLAVGPDGGLELPDNAPSSTTNKLYNDGGTLKFNGSAVGGGGGVDAANGSDNRIATFTDSDSLNGEANLTFDGSALTCIGTMTVGVDDTGHDVKFFGARSGSYVEWDESENRLHLVQGAYVNQPVPATGSTTEDATLQIDLSKGNYFNILLGADITAVEFQNATIGQKFIIRFIQATSGTGHGISWSTVRINGSVAAELKWASDIAPTMTGNDGTSHQGHKDVYGFLCTATGGSANDTKFDGFIIGQDIPN